MGENQSKPIGSSRKPLLGQGSPQPKNSLSNSNYSSAQQQQQQQGQLSPEEVRKMRLARMEKQEYVPERGLPRDLKSHPISLEFGANAYLVHMNLEDLYLNTFHPSSLSRNPRLKLLQPANSSEAIKLYTLENIDEVVMKFLSSENYYPGGERLVFLSDLYGRLTAKENDLISPDKLLILQGKILSCLMEYLLKPSVYDPKIVPEDPRVITDCNCSVFDALYAKLSSIDTDGFFHKFITSLPEEHYDAILTPLFKRMIRDSSENTLTSRFNIQKAIVLVQDLMQCDPKIAEFFFNHELFIPKEPIGSDFQKKTFFGAFLSFTAMNNDTQSMHDHLTSLEIMRNSDGPRQTLREKLHDPLNSFHRLIEAIIKLNPKYKKNILDWFYGALVANKGLKASSSGPTYKLATFGWLSNLTVLLLKLCQKMLEDPKKYPDWVTKIDLTYVFDKPLFENQTLLNGKSVTKRGQEQEIKQFSFLTELIFMTSHAWLLLRDAFQILVEATRKVSVLMHTTNSAKADSFTKDELEIFKAFYSGRVHLVDPYLTRQIHNLLNFNALLILHSFGMKIQDISDLPTLFEQLDQIEEDLSPERGAVLQYWAENIIGYITKYSYLESGAFTQGFDNLDIIMNFILCVIGNKKFASRITMRGEALTALYHLLPRLDRKDHDQSFDLLFKDNIYYQRNLLDSLFNLFIDAKTIWSSFEAFKAQKERAIIFRVLNHLLQVVFAADMSTCYVVKSLEKFYKNSTDKYFQVMDAFMEDLLTLTNVLCLALSKKGQIPNGQAPLISFHPGNSKLDQGLSFFLFIVKQYLLFVENVSLACPELLLNDLLQERLASSLNYCLKSLNGDGVMVEVKAGEMIDMESNPEYLLASLVRIYLNLWNGEGFMKSVISDEKNYNSYYFIQTQVFFEENGRGLNGVDKERLSQLVASLD